MKPMRVWVGGVLVTLGVLWLLDAAEVVDAGRLVDQWWPLAVIALAVMSAVAERRVALGTAALAVIGAVLLVDQLELVDDSGSIVWPVVALAAGVWVLLDLGARRGPGRDTADRQDVFALLGASQTKNRSQHFSHANVAAVLGGATLDLRDAHLEPGARVDALAVLGGVDVIVPPGWRVELGGLPVFGGYEDKTATDGELPPDAPVLVVSATAVFGGVDVKNTAD